jgi:steroid delta-isomerase-like uncharacterized protein
MQTQDGSSMTTQLDLPPIVRRYFDAWNSHDPAAIVATLGESGTYSDPATPSPLAGPALVAYTQGLFAAFPDLSFELRSAMADGRGRVVAEWLMQGTNSGPLQPGAPPTGGSVALPGVDLIAVEAGTIRSVQGYFDQKTFLEQLGLQVVAQPAAMGPMTFGTGVRIPSGTRTRPGAVSTTWIDVRHEQDRQTMDRFSQQVVQELMQMPGFISFVGGVYGNRWWTVTAWEDAESAHQILRLPAHKDAMGQFFRGDLGSAAFTSVWAAQGDNALWLRCAACGTVTKYVGADGRCTCGQALPESPPYW